jgi:hypothetical protein
LFRKKEVEGNIAFCRTREANTIGGVKAAIDRQTQGYVVHVGHVGRKTQHIAIAPLGPESGRSRMSRVPLLLALPVKGPTLVIITNPFAMRFLPRYEARRHPTLASTS